MSSDLRVEGVNPQFHVYTLVWYKIGGHVMGCMTIIVLLLVMNVLRPQISALALLV